MEPKRRIQIKLELGADSWEAAADALDQISLEIRMGQLRGEAVSGGYTSGYVYHALEDTNVTHETYAKALVQYIGERA